MLKRVPGESLCTKHPRPSNGEGLRGLGEMYEQRSDSCRSSQGLCRDIRRNYKLLHRTNQLQNYGTRVPIVSLIVGILSTGSLRISIPVQFCIRFVTTTGSCSSICAISTSTTASDTRANAKSSHDESLDWQDRKNGKSATEDKPETRQRV